MNLIRGEYFPYLSHKILVYYDKLYNDPLSINDGDIIYCDTHQINNFKSVLKQKKDLIIITHNSDGYVCDIEPWKEHGVNVNDFDGCYKTWYAQNSYSKKENVIPIPIGFENTRWEHTFGPKTQWLYEISEEYIAPTRNIYFNCNLSTNKLERVRCFNICKSFDFIDVNSNLQYKEYLREIKSHKFTISPEGNGLDCHRTWEILMMKRVPILKRCGSLEKLYKNMPVLFVDKWEDLQYLSLDSLFESFSFENQDYLNLNYWRL
jgi:hypothetical protein